MSDHVRKLLHSTFLYLPAQFIPPAVQFALTVLWTHLLDPAAFGSVTFVIAAQEFAAYLGLSVWSLFVLRFRPRFIGADETRFREMDKRMAVSASAVQLALTPPMLLLLGMPCDAPTVCAAAAYLITRMLLAHYGDWARAGQSIGAYTSGQLIGALVGAGLSVAAIRQFGSNPAAVLGALALGQALALAVVALQTGVRFGLGRFDRAMFRDVARFGGPSIIGGVVGWGAANIIRVLVQTIDGPVALGLISAGWSLGQRIAGVLAMLLTAAAFPLAVKHMESGDRAGALAQISLNGLLLLGVLAPATVGAAAVAQPMVTLLIAENFRESTIAILPVAICAASLRYLRIHVCDQAMILLERPELSMFVSIAETAMNVALCAAGLYVGGLFGGALGMLLGTTIACVAGFAYCFARLGLPAPTPWTALRIGLACLAMYVGVRALPEGGGAIFLAVAVLAGALIYATAIVVLFPDIRASLIARLHRQSEAPAQ
ncbi:O-antigen/teichoic acid export membrane protein [Rhodoblastus acidophilus]|uniref:lipopolysaccharide biosynthesis protein n=1 Tax=Rhodoblastus acidophilus TaxID=1074 RepID=UPI002224256A|nr:lipopolysaccharide biosynthesis protein [Rhodoblastus acidophilus]MCW2317523.1 O-antigen/teichoic acid export membrane protein [Rhodoblastus acidophilus]